MTDSWGSYRSWDLGSTQPSRVEGRLFVFDLEIGSVNTLGASPSSWILLPLPTGVQCL